VESGEKFNNIRRRSQRNPDLKGRWEAFLGLGQNSANAGKSAAVAVKKTSTSVAIWESMVTIQSKEQNEGVGILRSPLRVP